MDWKKILNLLFRLFIGLFLYSIGIVMTINSNLGLAPWDVFHQGLAVKTNMTIGQASILVGIVLVIINSFFKEKLGWGTLTNMIFIGLFIDVLMLNHMIPVFENYILSFIMMCSGMFIIGLASYYYMGAALGSGPRDGLMVVLTKKTKKSVRLIRNSIEVTVLIIGYFLGGYFGLGTIFMAVTIGFFVQLAFKLLKFDVASIEHRFIDEDIKWIKQRLMQKNKFKTEK